MQSARYTIPSLYTAEERDLWLGSFSSLMEPYCPESLIDSCLRVCLRHMSQTLLSPAAGPTAATGPTSAEGKTNNVGVSTLRPDITLVPALAERLFQLHSQQRHGKVSDEFLQLFGDRDRARLEFVSLRNSEVSDAGLRTLRGHPLKRLDISNCKKLTTHSLETINNDFGDTLDSLTVGSATIFPDSIGASSSQTFLPSIEHCSIYRQKGYILNGPRLRRLELRGLEPTQTSTGVDDVDRHNEYFSLITVRLESLVYLDLSHCKHIGDLSYLVRFVNTLRYLVLFNVHHLEDCVDNICRLTNLRHLDVSQVSEKKGTFKRPNTVLNQIVTSLPALEHLDISGTNLAGQSSADPEVLETFGVIDTNVTDIPGLWSRTSRPLEFLGLLGTMHGAAFRHHIAAKRIAGDANEVQTLIACQMYWDRPAILQRVLNDLFHLFRYDTCTRPRMALDCVIMAMQRHLSDKHVQVAGSASLFYIVKSDECERFNLRIKHSIIRALVDAMSEHRNDTTMLRNGCLTLLHLKIPQDVLFEYERLVDVLLYVVGQEIQEDFVQRIGIYLLNSVACQVDEQQKRLVGERGTIRVMLDLIRRRLQAQTADEVLETAWSTMWNVTDETSANCERFLDGGGLDLFLECYAAFSGKPELLRNMMGLLGNVAEVKSLRPRLMESNYIQLFSDLLENTSDGIEVSYNAAGILSHVLSDGEEAWSQSNAASVSRDEVKHRLVAAIERWQLHTKRNINYRSFEPILRLLRATNAPEAQHWSVWAIANLTQVYPTKYCPLMFEEKGLEMIEELIEKMTNPVYPKIIVLATMIVQQCNTYKSRVASGLEMPDLL